MWYVVQKLKAAILLLVHVIILIPVTVLRMLSFTFQFTYAHGRNYYGSILCGVFRAGGIYYITISILKRNHTLTPHPDSGTALTPYEAVEG